MIVVSNSTEQTLQPGQSITFDTVVLHTGNGECHRQNSLYVKLRCRGVYSLQFSGNISGATADTPVQLTIEAGGEPLNETTMISTPAAANAFNNVSTGTLYGNCCNDCSRISVTNTGTEAVTVGANTALTIIRKS